MATGPVSRNRKPLRVGACLSLSGRFARFGRQAARGLEAWRSLDGAVDLVVEDDRSDPATLEAMLPLVARRCDLLLGPYSTQLMRRAGRVASEAGWLLWNHGGSGDDVQAAFPGHVVSILTPTSQYAEPFLRRLASGPADDVLLVVHGKGSFGKQVTAGAQESARRLGLRTVRVGPQTGLASVDLPSRWNLFSAGLFEEDVELVRQARTLARPPRLVCTVAAGVRDFAAAVGDPEGVFGIGQWFPGAASDPDLGPSEPDFLTAYSARSDGFPDYPAVQAVAGAALATHCARTAGATTRDRLWPSVSALETQTLFGGFKINPTTGTQVKHEAVLVRWAAGRMVLA
jgi:ABC-type branched-subunit amino acid transport system substrate-binding protein